MTSMRYMMFTVFQNAISWLTQNGVVYPMFTLKIKNPHKSLIYKGLYLFGVIPLGLEPRTPTLKVLCSTD